MFLNIDALNPDFISSASVMISAEFSSMMNNEMIGLEQEGLYLLLLPTIWDLPLLSDGQRKILLETNSIYKLFLQ